VAKEDPESKKLWQEFARIEDKVELEKTLTELLRDYPYLEDLKKHISSVYDDLYLNDFKKITIDFVISGTIIRKLDKQEVEELILEIKKGANDFERALQDYINKLRVKLITKEIELYLCKHTGL
jgi:hypothetical protein